MSTPLTPGPAKKSLGQHFLFDPAILKRVATSGGPVEGKTVIEVGPGPGGLTRALLDSGVAKAFPSGPKRAPRHSKKPASTFITATRSPPTCLSS
jgi:16S rRNA A1518/A1519 N6-dimethyltransferase RsmA/KsgA/DIM1 with predicted DNA glycosylase/AP lyase activity